MPIGESELILNKDGSVFHLHLKPGELATDIILVGDPGRVEMISKYLNNLEIKKQNREFITVTGYKGSKRLSVVSTGIGTDNIDIVLNEIDALFNIDFNTRTIHHSLTKLRFLRIGTSGTLQPDIPVDSPVITKISGGFDNSLGFYEAIPNVNNTEIQEAFIRFMNWEETRLMPYFFECSDDLFQVFHKSGFHEGITISAPGFYGPQARALRLPLTFPDMNEKLARFRFKNIAVINYEMESSAIYGLSKLLGHEALTICNVIANRKNRTYSRDYKKSMETLVQHVLEKITEMS